MREDTVMSPSTKLWCNIGYVFHGGLSVTGGRSTEGKAGAVIIC